MEIKESQKSTRENRYSKRSKMFKKIQNDRRSYATTEVLQTLIGHKMCRAAPMAKNKKTKFDLIYCDIRST